MTQQLELPLKLAYIWFHDFMWLLMWDGSFFVLKIQCLGWHNK